MAINMALKRGRKAAHRKLVVAQKRRTEQLEASLPAQVLRAAQTPIQQCLLTESLFEGGIGTLMLARGASSLNIRMGSFLLDVFCLGIKDVMFRSVDDDQLQLYMAAMNVTAPMISVDPRYARKLLRDLALWSRSIGFPPHREFAAVERIFGDVDANASDAAFQFGKDGRPFYMSGPSETALQVQRRIEILREHTGEEGFGLEREV